MWPRGIPSTTGHGVPAREMELKAANPAQGLRNWKEEAEFPSTATFGVWLFSHSWIWDGRNPAPLLSPQAEQNFAFSSAALGTALAEELWFVFE